VNDNNHNSASGYLPPVTVELTRGGIVESQLRAHAACVDSTGKLIYSRGNPDYVTFLRSSAKPVQAMNVVLSGAVERFGLTTKELAICAGSHGGEQIHTETVLSILAKIGLTATALQCGVHPPLDAAARMELERHDEKPTALHHNCSGKHSGMLAAAVTGGYSISTYLDPRHPVQQRIIRTFGLMADYPPDQIVIGIDGCSAPVHGMPIRTAALAFARMVDPSGLPDEITAAATAVAGAMRSCPEMVAASRDRTCTELMRNVDARFRLIAKAGAEGYYATGWIDPDSGRGMGLTVKMEDGGQRGRDPITIALLQRFGVLPADLPPALKPFTEPVITNWAGKKVGEVIVRL